MTTVTEDRPLDGRIDPQAGAEHSLAELRPGQSGVIIGWNAALEPSTIRRFEDLGFCAGAEVTVLRRAPLGDPFVYSVAGYELAVRREHARQLRVVRR